MPNLDAHSLTFELGSIVKLHPKDNGRQRVQSSAITRRCPIVLQFSTMMVGSFLRPWSSSTEYLYLPAFPMIRPEMTLPPFGMWNVSSENGLLPCANVTLKF